VKCSPASSLLAEPTPPPFREWGFEVVKIVVPAVGKHLFEVTAWVDWIVHAASEVWAGLAIDCFSKKQRGSAFD